MPYVQPFVSQFRPWIGIACVQACDVAVFLDWQQTWGRSGCVIWMMSVSKERRKENDTHT